MRILFVTATRIGQLSTLAVLVAFVAGCTFPAPLDDAKILNVRLASTGDLARYSRAQEILSRQMFGGESLRNGKEHISFAADQYDDYIAYLRDHPIPEPVPDAVPKFSWPWPLVRVAFQSAHVLDPSPSEILNVQFAFCDKGGGDQRVYGFGMPDVMWHDQVVTSQVAQQIKKAIDEGQPQEYEIFFKYVFWDKADRTEGNPSVTLLPLSDDVCMALHTWANYPFPPRTGTALRIDKELFNNVVGPLPRVVSTGGLPAN